MNEERLGSTAAFAAELAKHLAAVPGATGPLPTVRELEQFVEVIFFAGLHEEESRRYPLSLAWTGASDGCVAAVALGTPVTATPKTLAKLAPAAQRESTSLAIRAEGDGLVVWALLQHGSSRELPLMIRSLRPGVLRVDYHGQPRALYARGEMQFLDAEHTVASPARRITSAFAAWRSTADTNGIDARAAVVTRVAAKALQYGHGGMILVLPTESEPLGVRIHYPVGTGGELLARRFAKLTEGANPGERLARIAADHPRRAVEFDRFEEAVELVAGLTGTDNALLVDTDLRVRGFGVQVIEGEAPLQEFRHVNPYTGASHIDDIATFKGTRHPAGVIFCLRQPDEAAAIIASQDRRLSLVVKDSTGAVEVLGSYEEAFGWR
jgi:hypothetical protein